LYSEDFWAWFELTISWFEFQTKPKNILNILKIVEKHFSRQNNIKLSTNKKQPLKENFQIILV
jgi:hypothetical protein